MAKRRLADLVQEEAKKETKASVIDVTATPVVNSSENNEVDTEATSESETQKEAKQEPLTTSLEEGTHLSKADLEQTIRELNELITQVHQSEANLQKQVELLQAALSEQKDLAEYSQKALAEQKQKADRSEVELKEAKRAALQLAEANSQLTQELEELKQYKAQVEELQSQQQQKQKPPAITKAPVHYKKSYGTFDRLPVKPSVEQSHSGDTSSPMWLLD
jgi:DNA repair exonuclease SbcCD ATPase subunit